MKSTSAIFARKKKKIRRIPSSTPTSITLLELDSLEHAINLGNVAAFDNLVKKNAVQDLSLKDCRILLNSVCKLEYPEKAIAFLERIYFLAQSSSQKYHKHIMGLHKNHKFRVGFDQIKLTSTSRKKGKQKTSDSTSKLVRMSQISSKSEHLSRINQSAELIKKMCLNVDELTSEITSSEEWPNDQIKDGHNLVQQLLMIIPISRQHISAKRQFNTIIQTLSERPTSHFLLYLILYAFFISNTPETISDLNSNFEFNKPLTDLFTFDSSEPNITEIYNALSYIINIQSFLSELDTLKKEKIVELSSSKAYKKSRDSRIKIHEIYGHVITGCTTEKLYNFANQVADDLTLDVMNYWSHLTQQDLLDVLVDNQVAIFKDFILKRLSMMSAIALDIVDNYSDNKFSLLNFYLQVINVLLLDDRPSGLPRDFQSAQDVLLLFVSALEMYPECKMITNHSEFKDVSSKLKGESLAILPQHSIPYLPSFLTKLLQVTLHKHNSIDRVVKLGNLLLILQSHQHFIKQQYPTTRTNQTNTLEFLLCNIHGELSEALKHFKKLRLDHESPQYRNSLFRVEDRLTHEIIRKNTLFRTNLSKTKTAKSAEDISTLLEHHLSQKCKEDIPEIDICDGVNFSKIYQALQQSFTSGYIFTIRYHQLDGKSIPIKSRQTAESAIDILIEALTQTISEKNYSKVELCTQYLAGIIKNAGYEKKLSSEDFLNLLFCIDNFNTIHEIKSQTLNKGNLQLHSKIRNSKPKKHAKFKPQDTHEEAPSIRSLVFARTKSQPQATADLSPKQITIRGTASYHSPRGGVTPRKIKRTKSKAWLPSQSKSVNNLKKIVGQTSPRRATLY